MQEGYVWLLACKHFFSCGATWPSKVAVWFDACTNKCTKNTASLQGNTPARSPVRAAIKTPKKKNHAGRAMPRDGFCTEQSRVCRIWRGWLSLVHATNRAPNMLYVSGRRTILISQVSVTNNLYIIKLNERTQNTPASLTPQSDHICAPCACG